MKIIKIILSLLLFIAVLNLPYGYYQFLRLIVFIAMSYFIFSEQSKGRIWTIVIYLLIAVLFNPIFPIYLTREIWFYIDIVTGIALFIISFLKPLAKQDLYNENI